MQFAYIHTYIWAAGVKQALIHKVPVVLTKEWSINIMYINEIYKVKVDMLLIIVSTELSPKVNEYLNNTCVRSMVYSSVANHTKNTSRSLFNYALVYPYRDTDILG